MKKSAKEKMIRAGVVASSGIATGKVIKIDKTQVHIPKYWIYDNQIADEIRRFKQAVMAAKKEIESLKKKLCRIDGQEQITILESHLMMVSDRSLVKETIDRIKTDKINAEWAYEQTVSGVEKLFSQVDDGYFSERQSDLQALSEKVLSRLSGKLDLVPLVPQGMIVVAKELTPVDAIEISKSRPLAFITELGGKAGHMAIVARSLNVPCLVGVEHIFEDVRDGDEVIVDGEKGCVFISPSDDTKKEYEVQLKRQIEQRAILLRRARAKAITRDHHRIHIGANAEWLDDIKSMKLYGAEGVGLFRTEYLFLGRQSLPDEESQFAHYKKILRAFPARQVTIRALDVGGDKLLDPSYIPEFNPALGVRGIRYCFKEKRIFYTQLRALLRASVYGKLRLLFSMVNSLEEVLKIKQVLARVKKDLEEKGERYDSHIPIGIMVETPAAALTMDLFCSEVDFFSIGTNDLTQYTLAVDRDNDEVNHLYDPLHPGHVRLLKRIVDVARANQKPISICGELASDPYYLYFLLGIGLQELSMNAASIPRIKFLLNRMEYTAAHQFVDRLFGMKTAKEINRAMENELSRLYPNWFDPKNHSFTDLGFSL